MRYPLTVAATCAAMIVSAGCAAQRTPASDHTPQAQTARNSKGTGTNLLSLFQQIQQLQQHVRDLQGQVDTLKYKLKQNKQGQQDLYQNLDKRLSALENGGGGPVGPASNNTANANGSGAGNNGSGNANVPADVQSAYMDGFNKLKNGQYDAAISAFTQFLSQYPQTALNDNAWYWLGEAYYVQQDTNDAGKAFQTVVNRFSNSSKVPASLYKIGLIEAGQGKTSSARSALRRVVDQYPNSDIASQARQKLQSLGG